MSEPVPDPTRWLADLFKTQQALLWPDAASGDTAPADSPWTQGFTSFTAWQNANLRQLAATWSANTPPNRAADPAAKPTGDRRFAGEPWTSDPRYDALVRSYQVQTDLLGKALDAAPLDERSKAQWSFALRQITDALSPANLLATNPEAMQLAMETGGASLADGMRLFVMDLAKGRISMTDDTSFEVGRNVCLSKGKVVYENELMQLIQYSPTTAMVHQRPLVIVPPCINKYYILDLQPENSFVSYSVAQGNTVFLVSWRSAGPDQSGLTWDDYVELGVLRAIDTALQITGADLTNTLGFCIGGTLLASALAVLAGRGEQRAASVTLLTTLLDFAETGELGLLVTEQGVVRKESEIGSGGVMAGRDLAQVFAALRANDLIWPYVVNSYLKGQAPPAFDLLSWNSDDTNLPGPMFCWYLRNTYLENNLRVANGTVQCGIPVDLQRVSAPSFVYASRDDHIVPWKAAYASTQLLGGESTFVLGASGHIAGVINPPAKNRRNHWMLDADASGADSRPEPAVDPQVWFDAAENVAGSWWPTWSQWLARHSGPEVSAREQLGSADRPPMQDAPGSYVKAKAS